MEAHKLTRERVRDVVPRGRPGFYRLGNVIDGHFYTSYFGRSDACLLERLFKHEKKGRGPYFLPRPTETVEEAHHLECLFYHLEQDFTRNMNHPARPAGTEIECPYCEFEQRLRTVMA